jgi:hypothetical protein
MLQPTRPSNTTHYIWQTPFRLDSYWNMLSASVGQMRNALRSSGASIPSRLHWPHASVLPVHASVRILVSSLILLYCAQMLFHTFTHL